MQFEDAELVARAKSGDRTAFATIYERHYTAIYTFAYYRLGDEAAAHDVAAEVFMRMVARIAQFEPRGKGIVAWLFTIARHLITDRHRSNRYVVDVEVEELVIPAGNNPAHLVELRMTQIQLGYVLQRLTDEQQAVLILRFVLGHSVRETAQQLNKSDGAVKLLQHRALASMRRLLVREYGYER